MKKILYLTSYAETDTHGKTQKHIFKLKRAVGFLVTTLWFTEEEVKYFQSEEGVEINITPYSPGIVLL